MDLSGATIEDKDLSKRDFSKAILRGADLYKCNLAGSNFRGADLSGAKLNRCNLTNCNLQGASLSGASLRYCDLTNCNLHGANLSGSNLDGSRGLNGIILVEATLDDAILKGVQLRGANLMNASLRRANLTSVDLSGANLCGCDLTGVTKKYLGSHRDEEWTDSDASQFQGALVDDRTKFDFKLWRLIKNKVVKVERKAKPAVQPRPRQTLPVAASQQPAGGIQKLERIALSVRVLGVVWIVTQSVWAVGLVVFVAAGASFYYDLNRSGSSAYFNRDKPPSKTSFYLTRVNLLREQLGKTPIRFIPRGLKPEEVEALSTADRLLPAIKDALDQSGMLEDRKLIIKRAVYDIPENIARALWRLAQARQDYDLINPRYDKDEQSRKEFAQLQNNLLSPLNSVVQSLPPLLVSLRTIKQNADFRTIYKSVSDIDEYSQQLREIAATQIEIRERVN